MKATFYLLTIIFFSICFVACEKDNLDIAPNATFGGEIRVSPFGWPLSAWRAASAS